MSLLPIFLNEFQVAEFTVQIDQEGKIGIGGMVWDAAVLLSKFISKNRESFKSVKRVVELGSGTGLCGLAVAYLLPQAEVVLTDNQPHVPLLQRNAELNGLPNVKVEELDWFHPRNLGDFDMVIGSDIVYEPQLFEPLLDSLEAVTGPHTLVYLCNELRMSRDLNFYKAAHKRNWTMTILPDSLLDPECVNPESPVMLYKKSLT